MNSLLAMLILLGCSLAVVLPLMIGIVTAGNNEAQLIGTFFTMYPLILVLSLTFGALFTVYHEIFNSPVNVPPATCSPTMQVPPQQMQQRW